VLGIPPKRDIDFTINLVLGATLLSKSPYILSTPEIVELKIQIKDLMHKKYIRPIIFPWDALVLFAKKKYGI